MPPQQSRPSTDLRPSRSQIEALLSEVTKDRRALQTLLDAFQDHGHGWPGTGLPETMPGLTCSTTSNASLHNRLQESRGVRDAGGISLGCCQPNRVQATPQYAVEQNVTTLR